MFIYISLVATERELSKGQHVHHTKGGYLWLVPEGVCYLNLQKEIKIARGEKQKYRDIANMLSCGVVVWREVVATTAVMRTLKEQR